MRRIFLVLAISTSVQAASLSQRLQDILAGISPDRIEQTLNKLESFETRYVMSDQDHPTRGIGAAKRWIYNEFKSYSPRLQVRLDPFTLKKGAGRGYILRDVELANIVAVLPGTVRPDSHVMVTAHYDSIARNDSLPPVSERVAALVKEGVPSQEASQRIVRLLPEETAAQRFAPGVTDNGSGVAAVLELARVMSQYEFDKTIVFIAFSGEEMYLTGSKAFADRAKNTGMQIEAVLNNDIIGTEVDGSGQSAKHVVRVFAEGPEDSPSRALLRYAREITDRYVPEMRIDMIFRPDRFERGGDHLSFSRLGYAAVRFTTPNENYTHQHTSTDTFKNTSVPYIARVARVNAAVLAALALAPAPPVVTRPLTSGRFKGIGYPMLSRGKSGYDAVLGWEPNSEPDLAVYAVVMRRTTSPDWERQIDVGNVKEYQMPGVSIDEVVLGVRAIDSTGLASIVSPYLPFMPTVSENVKQERK